MSSMTRWILIFAAIACAGAGFYYLSHREQLPQQVVISEPSPMPAPDNEQTEVLTRHPIPEPQAGKNEPEKPLPTLMDSDNAIQDSLGSIFDPKRLDELIIFRNFIDRVVVTIDNLPRTKLPVQHLPAKTPAGKFIVRKNSNGITEIDSENYKRYVPYVQLFEMADSRKLAALYFYFYPLFQEAYSNLGYKSAYFNDRVIVAIDDLLAAPELKEPPKLVQPSVFYKYADPQLEALSAGQKLMIRIGSNNAERVKIKLRELRDALIHHTNTD
jgi:Protein of unknown function (DUF3014)